MNTENIGDFSGFEHKENLSDKPMTPVDQNSSALTPQEVMLQMDEIRREWRIVDYGGIYKLESGYEFSSYDDVCKFVDLITRLCKKYNYAPDITFGQDYAFIALFTHQLKAIHQNDLIMAAKIDEMLAE